MDQRLEQALEFSNYRLTLNNQLAKLKIKSQGMLAISKNGGNFTINRELICFLDYLHRQQITDTILLDDNSTPILISNVEEFLKEITVRYGEVTNSYFAEFQSIRKSRNVKSILDI